MELSGLGHFSLGIMSSMFKGILPHKRVVSTDEFTMVTPPLGDVNGKENHPAQHRKANTKGRKQDMLKGKGQPSAPAPANPNEEAVGEDFDKLMVRRKTGGASGHVADARAG